MDNVLNLLDICSSGSKTLGPGMRYVIWVQGCPFHCKGCISPESQVIERNILVDIAELSEEIVSLNKITGITISGGEPFLQAKVLALLLKTVKAKRPELNVIVFTGYKIEDLSWTDALELISQIDALIDGPYIPELNDGSGLRGSSNQRIHFISDKLSPFREEMETGNRKVEIYINNTYAKIVGIPIKH